MSQEDESDLCKSLFREILLARQRVYEVGEPTLLQPITLPGVDAKVYVKREDLGPIKAYKWRGAYNCMATLTPEQRAKGVVAASAGNHAQGVALAAARLGCQARIYMPRSTPVVKQAAVKMHGGEHVEIVLTGDSYDAASHAAHEYADSNGLTFVHPYDDLATMGGQGTLADEVVMSGKGAMDRVYLQIGGGGLAAGCACWFRKFWPSCTILGVEGVKQASMKASVEAALKKYGNDREEMMRSLSSDDRETLEYVDVFCDGTAVRTPGEKTFKLCSELLDGYVTVTNKEVCQAIRALWENLRFVSEPSGAMGLAALLQDWKNGLIKPGQKCLVVISGANMDFAQLGVVSKRAGVDAADLHHRYLRLPMMAKRGEINKFLKHIPKEIQLTEVFYGRTNDEIQHPLFGMRGTSEQFARLDRFFKKLERHKIVPEIVTKDAAIDFRLILIPYNRERLRVPAFFKIHFSERPGAFSEFMEVMGDYADLLYFNYQYSGEQEGYALVGFDFESEDIRRECRAQVKQRLVGNAIQKIVDIPDEYCHQVLGHSPDPERQQGAPC